MDFEDAQDAVDRSTRRIDDLVPVSPETENVVLVDESRLTRWAGPGFALLCVLLIPWTVYLALELPDRQLSAHYNVAWVGYDVILILALAGTAYTTLRRSRRMTIVAAATGTLLVVDAWFDVLSAPSADEFSIALGLALLVELPLAALCFWLSEHAQEVHTRRLRLTLRNDPATRAEPDRPG
jgi:hypothetical protein